MISGKAKQFLLSVTKILIVAGAFWFIWRQLTHNEQLDRQRFLQALRDNWSIGTVAVLLAMSFANRFLEILKWQNLVGSFKKITVGEATKQVLAALTASIFTPNGIGEYAGKALYYDKSQTRKILFLNLVNNGIQMLLSVLFGVFGLLYFNVLFSVITTHTVGILLAGTVVLFAVLFTVRRLTVKGLSVEKIVHKINALPRRIHQKNIALGLARYLIFSHQYYFLFCVFKVDVPYWSLMSAIAATYFIASSLPAFQLFDFAVKGSVAVYFFSLLGVNDWIVIFIATAMWLLNVVLPVMIGAWYVLRFKTRTE